MLNVSPTNESVSAIAVLVAAELTEKFPTIDLTKCSVPFLSRTVSSDPKFLGSSYQGLSRIWSLHRHHCIPKSDIGGGTVSDWWWWS